jgi:sialidase-1
MQAQTVTEGKTSQWKGFEKVEFKMDTMEAFYINPFKPLAGNPWIWRAHFPNWHTEMDSILLEKGFHVAYINTNNLFAHPRAMRAWDQFYNYLVTQKGFASKVALEGVSRGALYVYAWAKRNPSRVSCIYTEAGVCDFTSWPGGKGRGKGSPNDWKKLKDLYGFTEEQALRYSDQPKDNLEGLASFKVPILHVIGLKDSLVPAEENTFVLVHNYLKNGGSATVIPMTRGKQELSGHHFPIEDPAALAAFIYNNNVPVAQPLKAESFLHPYGDLNNALYRITKERKATVAFLGGSITNMNGWRNKVMQFLQEQYPQTAFTFINAGIPSLGSLPHAFRVQRDVLDKGSIDLMFIEAAVNDRANGTAEIQQRRALEGIIRHAYAANPYMNLVLMAFVDEAKIAEYKEGKVPAEVKVHDDLSAYYHLPFINLAEEISERIVHKEFTWEDDFKNIHPSPFGMEIYFNSVKTLLQKEWDGKMAGQLTPVSLPVAMQRLTYTNAAYVEVDKAGNKKGFVIDPSWKPSDSAKTRTGFVEVPMLTGNTPGASFDLSFRGRSVGIAVVAGPDAGIIKFSIDGHGERQLDTFNRYSKSLHLPQYFLLGDDLKKGHHVLQVKIADNHNEQSKGTALRIAYFLVNQ